MFEIDLMGGGDKDLMSLMGAIITLYLHFIASPYI